MLVNPALTRAAFNDIADYFGVLKSTIDPRYGEIPKNLIPVKKYRQIPVLGEIACGDPILAEENIEEYVSLPTAIFGKGDFFILRASGQSMIEAGIDDGDLVVVKKQVEANDGDIVVALVDNQNTLKRYFRDDENKKIILHPENKKMKDIIVDECCIQGVACHIIKEL